MEEPTAPLRVLAFEAEFRTWLSRCPLDPAESYDRLVDVYPGHLHPDMQALADHELRALLFTQLREAVLDTLCSTPGAARVAIELTLPRIPRLSHLPDPALEMQKSLQRQAAAIKTLAPRCQVLFALRQREQLTLSQIAGRLQIDETEVERELDVALQACAAVTFSAAISPPISGPLPRSMQESAAGDPLARRWQRLKRPRAIA